MSFSGNAVRVFRCNFTRQIKTIMIKGKDRRPHIAIFGRRNNGKSSLINSLTGQETAIVSEHAGTTTDPVKKSVEIPGIGPAVLIDTAGFDDVGELGSKRVQKTLHVISQIDLAVVVLAGNELLHEEQQFIQRLKDHDIPFLFVHNKSDQLALSGEFQQKLQHLYQAPVVEFSCVNGDINNLRDQMRQVMPETAYTMLAMFQGLIRSGDTVVLITPVDTEAPEGRMILPQVQAIRDVLDHHAVVVVLKEDIAADYISKMQPAPVLVVTDSQAFAKADAAVPSHIFLTGFSVLLARQKGPFEQYLSDTPRISDLKDNDHVLILESCTHHVTCDDIGHYKIPAWLRSFTGKNIHCEVISGLDPLPDDLTRFALVIQCGGCMITRRQILGRLKPFIQAGVPITNYGMAIAWMHGIFHRATEPFRLKIKEN